MRASPVLHLQGQTTHARLGPTQNAFRYGIDMILCDAETARFPAWFARNRRGLVGLDDRDHGGAPKAGRGAAWLREVLAARGLAQPDRIRLLAQPRLMGHVFNPVAFWLCEGALGLTLVVAEVTNTYGDRHCYLCHRDDFGPITAADELLAQKVFHVSPFQETKGTYRFRFDIGADRLAIRIAHEGLVATLTGPLVPLRLGPMLRACLARPFGSARVLTLIHWQALRLWRKGQAFHPRPAPPSEEISR